MIGLCQAITATFPLFFLLHSEKYNNRMVLSTLDVGNERPGVGRLTTGFPEVGKK